MTLCRVADRFFDSGEMQRALPLYEASAARLVKIISRYLQAGMVKTVVVKLRRELESDRLSGMS